MLSENYTNSLNYEIIQIAGRNFQKSDFHLYELISVRSKLGTSALAQI